MAEFVHVSLNMFFDRAKVVEAMDRKTAKVLSSTGAFSRTVMKHGMRSRRAASAPGDYPSAHRGNALLRDMIFFGYDVGTKSVVVGPRKLNSSDREVAAIGKTVPQLINEGGAVPRRQIFDPQKKQIRRLRRGHRPLVWKYRPRPFVALTRPKAVEKFRQNMKDIELN